MAEYFVRGTTGNNASAGTSGATARQHHSSIAGLSIAAGDTINHCEQEDATALANFTAARLRFQNEAGSVGVTPSIVRGVVFPAAGGWAATGTRSYRVSIGTGLTLAAVIDRWTSRVDSNGRRACFLKPETSTANVDALTTGLNCWYYDSAGGFLYVQLNDSTNPGTLTGENRVGYVVSQAGCLVASGGNSIVEDMRWEFVRPAGSTAEYQCHMDNGGNIVRRVAGWDAAVHHVVFLSSVNDTLEDFFLHGGGQGTSGAESNTPIAAYSAAGNVSGLKIRRGQIHCYTHLAPSGSPLNSSAGCDGIKIHTDGLGGRVVADFELEDVWSHHYGQQGFLIDVSNPCPVPTSWTNPKAYPYKIKRGGVRGCRQASFGAGNAFVFVNTFFDMTGITSTSDAYAFWLQAGAYGLFVGCTFVFDQGSVAGRKMFRLEAGARAAFIHCSLINRSTNSTGPHQFFEIVDASNFQLTAYRSIFKNAYTGGTITRFIGGDSGAAAARYDFVGNIYHGIDSTKFSSDASRDSQAEWLASVDTTGQVFDPLFADINSADPQKAGVLSGTSPLLVPSRKLFVPGHMTAGINGRAYDGTIGAHQGGQVIANRVNSIAAGIIAGRSI